MRGTAVLKALVNIKDLPHYRRDAFVTGLGKHGYTVVQKLDQPDDMDLYVSWNLHGQSELTANRFRRAGARVLVCENGAIGKDKDGRQLYCIARNAHHAGSWYVGGPERWEALGIEVKPWQPDAGSVVLVCDQRGIGSSVMASPAGFGSGLWTDLTRRGIAAKLRQHPQVSKRATVPLLDDLKQARVCAVWSSMSGVQALVEGVPVAYFAPAWIASVGARQGMHGIENPLRDDALRMKALSRVAWAQWSIAEVEAGVPFDYLLRLP